VNPSTALGRVLVDELTWCGVSDVVLAPGSRSAPLAFALHSAAGAARLRLHVRIDERSAGFLAVGLARTRGIAAVVTTSGTAVANLHPAVLEAHHGGIPLVVLSADRPGELREVGANQTVDQVGIFGRSVRLFHEIAAPDARPGQVAYWRATASRAVLTARGSLSADPGPVHLNVAFREPLVPTGDGPWVEPLDGRGDGGRAWTDVVPVAEPVTTIAGPARTLLIVGDAPGAMQRAAIALGDRRGWPVVAEPMAAAGGADVISCAPLVLGAEGWLAEHRPDRILVVGRPTLSRGVNRLVSGGIAPVEAVSTGPSWPDPGHAVRAIHPRAVLAQRTGDPGDPAFLAAWRKAGERARAVVDGVLARMDVPTGLAAVRAAVDALPAESLLYLGSSSVVRDADLSGATPLPAEVHANRGVSGIDGTVSAAVGAALGRPDRPSYAIVGDLTFLHDSNGLIIGPDEARPDLCVVVVNDDGGGIFALLEQGAPEHAAAFERVFGTPTGTDLAALCAATATPHQRVTLDELPAALAPRPGLRVVEVAVDRTRHRDLHARLRAEVAAALATDPGPPER
jgi:2-succinyl-5-enolpyruvyl-6-hydroxy-3-cyclohexene-1-carboxylate synthase